MARTNVPVTPMVAGGTITADPAGTALDPTNGHIIGPRVQAEQIVIRVNNTSGSGKTLTLKVGNNMALGSPGSLGDLVMSLPTGVSWVGPFESGRFAQSRNDTGTAVGGFLFADVQAAATGTITVFNVPRNA